MSDASGWIQRLFLHAHFYGHTRNVLFEQTPAVSRGSGPSKFKVVTDLFEPGSFEGVFTRERGPAGAIERCLALIPRVQPYDENAANWDDDIPSRLELSGHGRKKKKLASLWPFSEVDGLSGTWNTAGHVKAALQSLSQIGTLDAQLSM
ncbi:unnamed protein product [Peronospora destructor]|uniref:Uncharacterized protein n=1 Tax=Peronospora destructor TaxID=86335 RepID=A0AAV0VAG9_9STRA|nr:unnamed protein product [Peronospora destructor]